MAQGGPSSGFSQFSLPPWATINFHEETVMNKEHRNLRSFFITIGVIAMLILVLSGCTSQEEKRDYRQAQVDMVQVQVNQKTQQGIADSQARLALYEAMAKVAETSPDSADAIAVALAVSSVREEANQDQGPIVQLQREENEALQVVKAVAPALITTIGTVGVAAIQAEVNKTQSDNAAAVAIADAATDADIMRSVTSMASTGLQNGGMDVGGDYYAAGNDIDQSMTTTTTNTETNTSTETNTMTETSNESTTENSYNTSDSYNDASDNSSNTSTSTSYQSADGSLLSYDDIVALLGAGLRVQVIIDGEPVEVDQAACADGSAGLSFGGDSVVCS